MFNYDSFPPVDLNGGGSVKMWAECHMGANSGLVSIKGNLGAVKYRDLLDELMLELVQPTSRKKIV